MSVFFAHGHILRVLAACWARDATLNGAPPSFRHGHNQRSGVRTADESNPALECVDVWRNQSACRPPPPLRGATTRNAPRSLLRAERNQEISMQMLGDRTMIEDFSRACS